MPDLVVTCPKWFWEEWINEGDAAGVGAPAPWEGINEYNFTIGGNAHPRIEPGERVYIVAHNRLRGYAPLVRYDHLSRTLVRRGEAVAVTIAQAIPGFRGYRYRWWEYDDEQPFPEWKTP